MQLFKYIQNLVTDANSESLENSHPDNKYNVIEAIRLLTNEESINHVGKYGWNALMLYCQKSKKRDIKIIKLLANEKTINHVDDHG